MCGAIKLKYDPSYKAQLLRYLSLERIAAVEDTGELLFAYWDKLPLLPAETSEGVKIFQWGNRDGSLSLPPTGWARLESLNAGKWTHLSPKVVRIPAAQGCEKGVWFPLESRIRGLYLRSGVDERVYMITEAASEAYRRLTGHHRMPRLHDP